ncbi:hypothetical protein [Arenimonas sp.]|uniref:hypothetical protein n=1 Tax=Arenimonas sp. TaxID=1872635 RepID=UPI002E37A805|nr:hypothetical protein [Arenimonas sp.]HEX4852747.1 hypothetical protein [Arenimonas sp.]
MADGKVEVPVVRNSGFFNIRPNSFVITQPTGDGGLQIVFCDDFVAVDHMTVDTSPEIADKAGNPQLQFTTSPERVAYGRIGLSLSTAKGLLDLLQVHVKALEKTLDKGEEK